MAGQDFLGRKTGSFSVILLPRKRSIGRAKKLSEPTLLFFRQVRVAIDMGLNYIRRLLVGIKDNGLVGLFRRKDSCDRDVEPFGDPRKIVRRR